MPERGFEYFPSPESGDDDGIIAYLFLHCSVVVDEWPEFRRKFERTGQLSPEQCAHIEKHAVDIFRECRDAILKAIETGNPADMQQPRMLDRLIHAHALLALFADTASLVEYRRMIDEQIDSLPAFSWPEQSDFNTALWEGKWNAPGDRMPAEVTREETHRSWRSHQMDGLYNSRRLEPITTAGELDGLYPAMEEIPQLSSMELAFFRAKLRFAGERAGLTKEHADFLTHMALDGAKEKDNPSAWRAIRDRKQPSVMAEVRKILASAPKPKNYFWFEMRGLQRFLS